MGWIPADWDKLLLAVLGYCWLGCWLGWLLLAWIGCCAAVGWAMGVLLAGVGCCCVGWAPADWDKLLLAGLDPKTERLKSKTTGASSSSAQQAVA